MSDQSQRVSYRSVILWAAITFLAIFPIFTVNSTTTGMRVTWISTLLIFGFLGVIVHIRTKDDVELQQKGPFVRRYRPVAASIILGALMIAEILAVAATYASQDRPLLWRSVRLISSIGDAIFPLVGKYATQMTPPLAIEVLYKVQAVTTLSLAAGALIFIILVPYFLFMPRDEAMVLQRIAARSGTNYSPTTKMLILPFAILAGFALFLGWFEFKPDPTYLTHKKCSMKAACYVGDDLRLIATGFFRIFGGYGFWLGAFMLVVQLAGAETD